MNPDYFDCYRKIAQMHLDYIDQHGVGSPFVPPDVYRKTQEEMASMLCQLVRDNTRVLDVGIGPGFLMEALSAAKPSVSISGIDIAEPYLDRLYATKKGWNVCYGDAERIPFWKSAFDYVVCCDVLEHVLDVHQLMREVIRVLHPGGMAFFRTPFAEDLSGYPNSKEFPYCHVRSFDVPSLTMLITKCHGQEVLACGPGQAVPSELFAVMRTGIRL